MGGSLIQDKKSMTHTLRGYKHNKARLKQVINELNYIKVSTSKVEGDRVQSGGIGNPTLQEVEKRGKLIQEHDRLYFEVETVENFLDALTGEQREIVKHRYFECYRVKDCLDRLDLERHYFYAEIDKIHEIFTQVVGN